MGASSVRCSRVASTAVQAIRTVCQQWHTCICNATDLQIVRDEIATLRDDMSREVQNLWVIVTSLQKESAQEANVKREPEEVRFSQEEVQSIDSRKGKGHAKPRSRKSRALAKSHSTKSRRKRRQSIDSDDSLSRSDESDAGVSEPERDDIRVADKDCRRILSVDRYRLLDREPERDLDRKSVV